MVTNDILFSPAVWRMRQVPSNEERRRRLVRDGVAWILVALIHLLIFLTLVISLEQARLRQGVRSPIENILDLSLLRRNNIKPLNLTRPEDNQEESDISAKPITIIPPKIPVIPEEKAAPAQPGDVLNSVGQFLACGASNFEYLTPAQQARCKRQPWRAVLTPNGSLVLDAQPKLAPEQPQLHISGAEALGHQGQTNSGCPIMINMPCLQDMFSGSNSAAPGIPDPH